MRITLMTTAAGAVALASSTVADAQMGLGDEAYVSVSGAVSLQQDSDNSGAFTSSFVTGAGVGVTVPAGADVGWTTEFDNGYAASAAIGARSGALRGEVELAFQSSDIDTHSGVSAAGLALDSVDAGVLITGSAPLGVTVGELVDDGQGSIESLFVMANAYYDFSLGDMGVKPYVGGGLGYAQVDVDYSPSGVGIVDDDSGVLAYQAMAGATLPLSERIELFGGYRYRATEDVEVDVSLFPATLEIENETHLFEVGLRYAF